MNTISITLNLSDIEKFLDYNKKNRGPRWMKETKETIRTVIPVCLESRAEDFVADAAEALGIKINFNLFYQDPGDGSSTRTVVTFG